MKTPSLTVSLLATLAGPPGRRPCRLSHETLMRILLFAGAVALLAAPVGAQTPVHPSVHLPPELERVLRDYETAWRARDAQGLAALFTEDGFVLSPGIVPARGRSAITTQYATSGGPLALRAIAYATADTVGYVIGAYARAPGQPDIGKFVLVLRQGPEGRWLIAGDMDNGINP